MLRLILFTIVVVSLGLSFLGCNKTPKDKVVVPKQLGAFSFVESKSEKPQILAEFSGMEISRDEVHKKSRVIQEILEKEEGLKSALLYRMAKRTLEKMAESGGEMKESYSLRLYVNEPKETLPVLLTHLKLEEDERIQYEFVGPDEAQEKSGLIGTFLDKDYTFDLLEKNHVRYIELITQKYDEYVRQIKGIFKRRLLFQVAKKANIPVQDFVKQKIVPQEITATEDEVVAFMTSKNILPEQMTDPLKKSFTSILIEKKRNEIVDKYISQNLAKEPVKVFFRLPKVKFDINPEWAPVLGPATADSSMYFFTNPNCSVCANAENNILSAYKTNTFNLNFNVFYFFPDWDREARLYAEASMCAFLQDKEQFWKFHSRLVNFEEKVKESHLYEFSDEIGLDTAEFKSCVLQRKTKDIVNYHLKYSDYLGINSQPTLVVGGKIYPGVVTVEKMAQVFTNEFMGSKKEESKGLIARVLDFFKGLFS